MADKNIDSISDEKLEDVTGGKGDIGMWSYHNRKIEELSQEALKRLDPKDPSSWFQIVADVCDEKFKKKLE